MEHGPYQRFIDSSDSISAVTQYTFTTPTGTRYVRFQMGGAAANIQLEAGSTVTTFEAYKGIEETVNLPTTTFGGSLILDEYGEGDLTVDHGILDLGSLTWDASTRPAFSSIISADIKAPSSDDDEVNAVCSMLSIISATTSGGAATGIAVRNNKRVRICWPTMPNDSTELTNMLKGQTLCFELATPLTYHLTANQIKTLLGSNTIWCDAGTVEIDYCKDLGILLNYVIALLGAGNYTGELPAPGTGDGGDEPIEEVPEEA